MLRLDCIVAAADAVAAAAAAVASAAAAADDDDDDNDDDDDDVCDGCIVCDLGVGSLGRVVRVVVALLLLSAMNDGGALVDLNLPGATAPPKSFSGLSSVVDDSK